MLEFTVQVKGHHDVEGGQASWVLAADPTAGVLIAHGDKSLHWHPLEDCTFAGMIKPGTPQPVYAVEPAQPDQKKPSLVAVPNRVERRAMEKNGA